MSNAKNKINAAVRACDKVHTSWAEAAGALSGSVGVNGYGIFNNPHQLRHKLESARNSINEALSAIDKIDWPTEADYDEC